VSSLFNAQSGALTGRETLHNTFEPMDNRGESKSAEKGDLHRQQSGYVEEVRALPWHIGKAMEAVDAYAGNAVEFLNHL
jgi:hypothetical protein